MDYRNAMNRVLSLALKGSGKVSPNPRVGAVILRDGEIIGEGWHQEFGGPHAEVNAIANSGLTDFSDCTIVVNLEPCSHFGKTPPCADMIIEKKFLKVVIGMKDPNPQVAGNGISALRNSGVEVIEGILEDECIWLNRFFIKNITTGLPYVIIKIAQTLNGAVATSQKESKWLTGEESRKLVHAIRAEVDAVLIGKETAISDDPELTIRSVEGVNPKRIVLDTNLSLPLSLKLFTDEWLNRTIVCCSEKASKSQKAETLKTAGVNILPVELNESGRIDIQQAMKKLSHEFKIASVLVEGGAGMYSAFAENDLIDELRIFQAPMLIGNGINALRDLKTNKLSDSKRFKLQSVSQCGQDIHGIWVSN